MPNLGGITQRPINGADRAIRAWNRIQRDPSSVSFIRGGVKGPAQTVRIEISNGGRGANSPLGNVGNQAIVIFGVKDHPSEADTDMKRLDRIMVEGKEYTIDVIVTPPGEVQGFGSANQ